MAIFENAADCVEFLPVNMDEASLLGYEKDNIDFVLISGDAYVDHPSFGAALIGKLLTALGYSVGLVAQPQADLDYKIFGKPRLAFLVAGGNVDSMVNHYTAAKKRRSNDYYSPGNKAGLRPDRAVSVYSRKIRGLFGKIPLIIGGLEASLRRLGHYDYWSDSVRKSMLLDSGADLLVYGMGERAIAEIAEALRAGVNIGDLQYIDGTVYKVKEKPENGNIVYLPAFAEICADKKAYAESFKLQYENTDYLSAKSLCEYYESLNTGCYVVQTPPQKPLSTEEMDFVYGLNFARKPHKMYDGVGVPSIEEVQFSITSSRGCFGGCSFCALSFHQGRAVTSRSHESIVEEAKKIIAMPGFKGYIHDVGGPTANFRKPSCKPQEKNGICKNKRCLAPEPCKNLIADHSDYLELLRKLRALNGVKKVFIRSGIRFDYLMYDRNNKGFFEELCEHHISGQLKVAPEHVSKKVLKYMGKPPKRVFDDFSRMYTAINRKLGKNQFMVPYLMSSHPGSGLREAIELAEYLRDNRLSPEQVQDFYPTPGTVSTCMYHTGLDPFTGEPVYTAKSPVDKAMQRSLIQYKLPQNEQLVRRALKEAGREDLIGYGANALLRPRPGERIVQKEPRAHSVKKKKTIRNIHKKKK